MGIMHSCLPVAGQLFENPLLEPQIEGAPDRKVLVSRNKYLTIISASSRSCETIELIRLIDQPFALDNYGDIKLYKYRNISLEEWVESGKSFFTFPILSIF